MFKTALYASLILSVAGLLFRIWKFKKNSSFLSFQKTAGFDFIALFFNTLFQTKLFCASRIRWAGHFLLLSGFMFLLLFHALDELVSFKIFQYYQPTLDPFQLLRNLAGVVAGTGCLFFLFKKFSKTKPESGLLKDKNIKLKGVFSILLILSIIGSGFMLEATKIMSEPRFLEMVEEYSGLDEEFGLNDLKAFWAKNYHVIFKELPAINTDTLEQGRLLNEEYCLYCHSEPKSAFLSKALSHLLGKAGLFLNSFRADLWLYKIHYLLAFLMLACLPFSRMLHTLLIPFASAKKKVTSKDLQAQKNFFNPAALSACTNCGLCSQVCSVYPNFAIKKNKDILPHFKIETAAKMINSKELTPLEMNQLRLGNDECTMCGNCTDICPSSIDLQGLWVTVTQTLEKKGYPDNYNFIQNRASENRNKKLAAAEPDIRPYELTKSLEPNVNCFENCVQCTICTNVCPIVEYDTNHNDMTPQQIMNLLRLGRKKAASETLMVWNCLTCYSCQEHCPSQIKIADIMMELKNIASLRADRLRLNAKEKADK